MSGIEEIDFRSIPSGLTIPALLLHWTGRKYTRRWSEHGPAIYIVRESGWFSFGSEHDFVPSGKPGKYEKGLSIEHYCRENTAILIPAICRQKTFSGHEKRLVLPPGEYWFEQNWPGHIMAQARFRWQRYNKISLSVHNNLKWNITQCIGRGCFGQVWLGYIQNWPVAIKRTIWTKSAWQEYCLLRLFCTAIKLRACPNIPLCYGYMYQENDKLDLSKTKYTGATLTLLLEPACGTLRDYLQQPYEDGAILSALFQVLAAVSFLQKNGQVMHYDLKKENVLFYQIQPGGYWHYIIDENHYYVPNHGFIFVLTDLGLARPLGLEYPYVERLGHRKFYVSVTNELKQWSTTTETLSPSREKNINRESKFSTLEEVPWKDIVHKERGWTVKQTLMHPDIVPPAEYYNDVQDSLRMFIGGKRTTQKGNHRQYAYISSEVKSLLKRYSHADENSKVAIPTKIYHLYAPALIDKIFFQWKDQPANCRIVEKYNLNHYKIDTNMLAGTELNSV
jgi:serine/threonine protein kinase